MQRSLLALSLALLLLVPSLGVAQETCISTGSGTFFGPPGGTATWSCFGPTSDDTFIIVSPHTITTDGDEGNLDLRGAANEGGAQVTTGTWVIRDGPIIDIGNDSFFKDTTGTIAFVPRYRDNDTATNETGIPATPDDFWRVPAVVPCPDIDANGVVTVNCTGAGPTLVGDPNHLGFFYDRDQFGTSVPIAIGNVSVGDLIQFVRSGGADSDDMSFENAQMYEIRAKGSAGTGQNAWDYLVINVTQGLVGFQKPSNYPIARRRIQTSTTNAAIAKRDLSWQPAAGGDGFVTADGMRQASWVYFSDDPAPPSTDSAFGVRQHPVLMGRTVDGGAGRDTWLFAHPDGAPFDVATGADFYLLNAGIRPGDPFIVIDPIIIRGKVAAADFDPDVGGVTLLGQNTVIEGVLFDNLTPILFGSNFDTPAAIANHWGVWDTSGASTPTGSEAIAFRPGPGDPNSAPEASFTTSYLSVAGTSYGPPTQPVTGSGLDLVASRGLAPIVVDVADIAVRYYSDDCILENFPDASITGSVRRVHCSYGQDGSGGAVGASWGNPNQNVPIDGLVCLDCLNHAPNPGEEAVVGCADDLCQFNDVLAIGRGPVFLVADASTDHGVITGLTAIGGVATNIADGISLDGFVFRDWTVGASNIVTLNILNGTKQSHRNGLVYRNTATGHFWRINAPTTGGEFFATSNVAYINNSLGAVGAELTLAPPNGDPFNSLFERITFGSSGSLLRSDGIPHGDFLKLYQVRLSSTAAWQAATFRGFAIEGYNTQATLSDSDGSAADNAVWEDGPCLSHNVNGTTGASSNEGGIALDAGDAPEKVLDADLEWVSPQSGGFIPRQGGLADVVGCGADSGAGITSRSWTHRITGLTPENLGALADSDLDGTNDALDNCPTVANAAQTDADTDALGDVCDNCVAAGNPAIAALPFQTTTGGQLDDDADGYGNSCDADFNQAKNKVDGADLDLFKVVFNKYRNGSDCDPGATSPCDIYDLDGAKNKIDAADLAVFGALFNQYKGPRCPSCPLSCSGDACP